MSKAQEKRDAQDRSLALLRSMLSRGAEVNTVKMHTSRSAALHVVRVLVVEDGKIRDMSSDVARALGVPFDRDRGGVRVSGGGMDMAFDVVHSLGHALWSDGRAFTHRAL